MRYRAEATRSPSIVKIHCEPSWWNLLSPRSRTVYAQLGETDNGWPLWVLVSGREVTDGMRDAIDELQLVPAKEIKT